MVRHVVIIRINTCTSLLTWHEKHHTYAIILTNIKLPSHLGNFGKVLSSEYKYRLSQLQEHNFIFIQFR